MDYRRKYYLANRERILEYTKSYVDKHREKYKEYYRNYHQSHTRLVRMVKTILDKPVPEEPELFYTVTVATMDTLTFDIPKAYEADLEKAKPKVMRKPKNKNYCEICDVPTTSREGHLKSQYHIIRAQADLSKKLRTKVEAQNSPLRHDDII
jgi:hypothetical protein